MTRKHHRAAATVLTALFIAAGCGSARAADFIEMRAGLPNTFAKLAGGRKTTVAYFGGSITAGAGSSKPEFSYRARFTRSLRERFPKADLVEVNAALGGTGSWLGAFRLRDDVLAARPDLVIVEFAVNDGGSPEKQVYAAMEGIVRQIRTADPTTEILFAYTMVNQQMDAYRAGKLPAQVQWHEKVAGHYGLPSVHMAKYAAAKVAGGELSFEEFAKDGVHPTDRGYELYLLALKAFVDEAAAAAAEGTGAATPRRYDLPAPLSERPMEHASLVPPDKAKADGPWKAGEKSPVGKFKSVMAADAPGATLTLKFKGSAVGYFDAIGPDTGDLEYSLDGGPWQPKPNWDRFCKTSYRPHARVIADGLDPAKVHELKLRIAGQQPAESKGRWFRVGYFLVDGEVVSE